MYTLSLSLLLSLGARASAGKDRTSGLKCTGLCEWCPVLDRKRTLAGRRKTIPTISYKTFQPTEQVANFVIHSALCPVTSAKSLVGDINFIVLRTSFRPCYFNVEEEFLLFNFFFFVAAIYRINWRERFDVFWSSRFRRSDEDGRQGWQSCALSPHSGGSALYISEEFKLDSTRRSSSHPHTST